MNSTAPDKLIAKIIGAAFDRVQTECGSESGAALAPAQRSQRWLNALNGEFQNSLRTAADAGIRSLCKACADNKEEFGLNELLHDVCVVRIDTVESHLHKKPLTYIKDVLWQVESEFSSSGTEVAIDFNKLILGSAQNKLYIGPLKSGTLASLGSVHATFARSCSGNVYLAFLPMPDAWPSSTKPKIYRFDRGSMKFVPSTQ